MKNNRPWLYRGFAALSAALLMSAVGVLWRQPERGMVRLDLSKTKIDRVDHVTIGGEEGVELLKDGAVWRAASGREADQDAVATLLRTVRGLRSSQEVQQDDNAQREVQLDGAASVPVVLMRQTQVLAQFVVGQSTGMTSWVRHAGHSFRVANLPAGIFRRPRGQWLQRHLFAHVKPAELQRIEVAPRGESPYAMERAAGDAAAGWRLVEGTAGVPRGFRFDAAAAARMATTLSQIEAESIVEQDPGPTKTHLDAPQAILTMTWRTDAGTAPQATQPAVLKVGDKNEAGATYAAVEGRNDVYLLPAYIAGRLAPRLVDLRDMTIMAPFAVEEVVALHLDDGHKKLLVRHDGPHHDGDGWEAVEPSARAANPTPVDRGRVMGRLRQIMGARAAGLAHGDVANADFGRLGHGQIVVDLKGARHATMSFGRVSQTSRGEPEGVVVRGSAEAQPFVVPKGMRQNLLGMLDTLKEAATANLGALSGDSLQGLPPEIRRAVEAQMAAQGGLGH